MKLEALAVEVEVDEKLGAHLTSSNSLSFHIESLSEETEFLVMRGLKTVMNQ